MTTQQQYFHFFNKRLSIRRFLTVSLLALMTISMLILASFNYFQMKKQNEMLFQMQMVNGAKAIDTLLAVAVGTQNQQQLSGLLDSTSLNIINNIAYNLQPKVTQIDSVYQDAIAFQVYSRRNGSLILNTGDAPRFNITRNENHFETLTTHDGNDTMRWYVFAMDSQYQPYKIVVLVNADFKRQVFWTLFYASLWNLGIIYLFLIFACSIIVNIALRPLEDIKRAIAAKNPRNLEVISIKHAPPEVAPILNELNTLFTKFKEVLEREKRFSGDAAHEMKTPLAALRTQAEVALKLDDIAAMREKIKYIIDSAERYSRIVDQLLILSRLEPQEDLPDKEVLNLNTVAELQIADLAIKAIHKDIDLEFEDAATKPMVYGSKVLLGIMLRNIIDNAILYTPNEGVVKIELVVENERVIARVTDSGVGVPEDKVNRIFDRFYRELGTGQKGSGLGLSIVKEIVRLHDGTVIAKNAQPNGLIMEISLPYSKRLEKSKV